MAYKYADSYFYTWGASGVGGLVGNTLGQISGGVSLTGIDTSQVAVQGMVGALSGEYGFIYATTRGAAVAVSAIPSLSAATASAISVVANNFIPTSLGGLHPK